MKDSLADGTSVLGDRKDGKVAGIKSKFERPLSGKDGPRCEHSSPITLGLNAAFNSPLPNVAINATESLAPTSNNGSNATSGNETTGSKSKTFLEAVLGSAPAVGSGAHFTKSPHVEVRANSK